MTGAHSSERTARRGKSFWTALAVGVLAGLAAGIIWSALSDAGYESTTTAFVAFTFPPNEQDPFSGSQFVTQRIDSYAQLGESEEVLQALASDIGGRSASDVGGHVEVSAVPGTVLLRITAQDFDQNTSVRLANAMLTHLNDAVVAVEAGGPNAVSPIGLVRVQPAISGPASSLRTDMVKVIGCLAVGLLAGVAVGLMLPRRRLRDEQRQPPPPVRSGPEGSWNQYDPITEVPVRYEPPLAADR